ncbi:MAG: thiamine phosphate synthase [Campylobacterota bacterium]|nr:thiamine phosphate synthase [Campylobacterota bacterium]
MLSQIYTLCDSELLLKYNISLSEYIRKIAKYNIVYIQYRDKINSIDIQKKNLLYLKSLVDIPIIINDKIELLDYCDGLHLGQEDLLALSEKYNLDLDNTIKFIRKKYSDKIIGISTHNEIEILETNKLDIDYIGLGAYRSTSTKNVLNLLGDNISYLAKISKHPVGAIGGVRVDDKIPNINYNVIGSGLLN